MEFPTFGKWYSKKGIYRTCPKCGYLNKYDASRPLWTFREAAQVCPNCGAPLTSMSMKALVVACVLAAGILAIFSFLV